MEDGRTEVNVHGLLGRDHDLASGKSDGEPLRVAVAQEPEAERPVLPVGVEELYERPASDLPEGARILYRPALAIDARLHFSSASERVEEWRAVSALAPLEEEISELLWDQAVVVAGADKARRSKRPLAGASYAAAPAEVSSPRSYQKWQKELKDHVYRTCRLTVWKNRQFRIVSRPDEPREEVLAQVEAAAHAECDEKMAEQRARYEKKIDQQRERIRKAAEKVDVQEAQYSEHRRSVLVSIGSALVGLFTKRRSSGGASAARRASRAAREKSDVRRAERELEAQERQLTELEAELDRELAALEDALRSADHVLEERIVRPRNSDIVIETPAIVWQPLLLETGPEGCQETPVRSR